MEHKIIGRKMNIKKLLPIFCVHFKGNQFHQYQNSSNNITHDNSSIPKINEDWSSTIAALTAKI